MIVVTEPAAAANPVQDPERLLALRETGLLDSPAEEAFDRLTRLAARALGAPIALLSFVDAERQFFKSAVGLPDHLATARQMPLTQSLCKHVVRTGEPLLLGDISAEDVCVLADGLPLTSDERALTTLNVRAYAGVPLTSADGHTLGSLCVLDSRPRDWTDDEVALLNDLAAAARSELALRRALRETDEERRAREVLLQSTGEGIYGIDQQGRCTFLNNAAAGMLRLDPDEALGLNMHELVHHSRADGTPYPEAECPIFQASRQGIGCRLDDEVLWRSDGVMVPVEYASSPVIDGGYIRGAVVTFNNIAARKRLEALRDDLTDMMVHDLRTPLTSVLTGLQTLAAFGGLNPEQEELVGIASGGARTLLGMVNDLLDISKMESGTFAPERQPVEAASLVGQSMAQVALLARQKRVTLESRAAPGLPVVAADEEKLRRVLVNLLGNAIKFTPTGGTITVCAERRGNDNLVFSVADTGEGIPADAVERVFDKFAQVESRRAGRKMSTGLGLTFCKMAVEAHGGRIGVDSELGKGSVFWFTLPLPGD
jgi:PAS domain S-box-containing protein